jgi:hypothetical protein
VQSSDIIDRATVRLSTPPASGTDSAGGYTSSDKSCQLSPEDLQKAQSKFGPGESALLLLSPTPDVSQIKRTLGIGGQSHVDIVELTCQGIAWSCWAGGGRGAAASFVPVYFRTGCNARSWKSKLKSTASDSGTIRNSLTLPSGFRAKVA